MDASYRHLAAWVTLCAWLGGCSHTATLAFCPEQLEEAQGLVAPAAPEMIAGVPSDTDIFLSLPEGHHDTPVQTVTGEIGYTPVTQGPEAFARDELQLRPFGIWSCQARSHWRMRRDVLGCGDPTPIVISQLNIGYHEGDPYLPRNLGSAIS